jgi:hypothetical protein
MVTIVDYEIRSSDGGKEFFVLTVQGGIEMVQSKSTNRFYATARKCGIPSTFDENVCQGLVGTQMAGTIEKVSCEPYEYTIQETGEVIDLAHRWEYQPEEVVASIPDVVAPESLLKEFSLNGQLETV